MVSSCVRVSTQGPHSQPLITKADPFPSFSPPHTSALSPSPDTVLCILRFDSYTRLVKNENIRVCIRVTKNQKASVICSKESLPGRTPHPNPSPTVSEEIITSTTSRKQENT